jgi:hypothetical protein
MSITIGEYKYLLTRFIVAQNVRLRHDVKPKRRICAMRRKQILRGILNEIKLC